MFAIRPVLVRVEVFKDFGLLVHVKFMKLTHIIIVVV